MKIRHTACLWVLASVMHLPRPGLAQLVPDGGSAVVDGTMLTLPGDLVVGANLPFTTLLITNAGQVFNANAVVGLNTGSDNNRVTVAGPGSLWTSTGVLIVGSNGSGNQLLVAGGARAASAGGVIGAGNPADAPAPASGQLRAQISPTSSLRGKLERLWLKLTGRQPLPRQDIAFAAANTSGSANTVLVTGPGSLWTNSGPLVVGQFGSDNRLIVSNGGEVTSASGLLGEFPTSSNNRAEVTGAGSVWSNQFGLTIGGQGAGNQLWITGGGVILNDGDGSIGSFNSSSGNQALVAGAGSKWVNAGELRIGEAGAGNRLEIAGGGYVSSAGAFIGHGPGASNNTVLVTGPGSQWTNDGVLNVGFDGAFSQLIVSDGGTVQVDRFLTVGAFSASVSNRVSVQGGRLIVQNPAGTGLLDIRRGTVHLTSTDALTTDAVQVGPQGTLLFGGDATVTDRINDAARVTLNGGRLETSGRSETLGVLTLSASSTLDLGEGASVLRFADSSGVAWAGGAILTVLNWSGSTAGSGMDQLIFGDSSSALTTDQLARISFLNPFGFDPGAYPAALLANGEVVPVPEPGTGLAALTLLALLAPKAFGVGRAAILKRRRQP